MKQLFYFCYQIISQTVSDQSLPMHFEYMIFLQNTRVVDTSSLKGFN
jgi:hypothetical protein